MGRPTKYKKKFCKKVVELMAEGRSKREVCAILGIHHDTLYEWAKRYNEFSDALKKGEQVCARWWNDLGRRIALGEVKDANATVFVWMTKNILGYHDKQTVEHTGPDGKEIKIEVVFGKK